jgi:hypothetical protein
VLRPLGLIADPPAPHATPLRYVVQALEHGRLLPHDATPGAADVSRALRGAATLHPVFVLTRLKKLAVSHLNMLERNDGSG